MHSMTDENLRAAFAGESQAHMKYLVFADKAQEEGFRNIARLFSAIAYAERVHATIHLDALSGAGRTADNLEAAIGGENFEVDEMYPAYKAVAELQDEKQAVRSMHYALEAEKIHSTLYEEALEAAKAGKDIEHAEFSICPVCGHTVTGQPPGRCPICGLRGEKFRSLKENTNKKRPLSPSRPNPGLGVILLALMATTPSTLSPRAPTQGQASSF